MNSVQNIQDHFTFNITDDTSRFDKKYGITNEIKDLLSNLYPDTQKGKKSTIKKLHRLCKRHPNIPQLKNYLSIAYSNSGNEAMAKKINNQLIVEHPGYIFSLINMAAMHIEEGNPDAVPHYLGKEIELQALFPERNEFHIEEVLSFYSVAVGYYLAKDKQQRADDCLNLLEELDPFAPQTIVAMRQLLDYNFDKSSEQYLKEKEFDRTVTSREHRKSSQTDQKPEFTHKQIDALYQHDLNIPGDLIQTILELPQKTLISDLENVLVDCINRFEHIKKINIEKGWDEKRCSFPVHALLLLTELESETSLDVVLDLLRQGEDFVHFWFGDALETFFIEPVAILGKNRVENIVNYVKEPNNPSYTRNIGVRSIERMAEYDPGFRQQTIEIFDDWFDFHLNRLDDDRVIDTTLISYIVWSCINLSAGNLLSKIKRLYQKNLVLLSIVGDFNSVKKDLQSSFTVIHSETKTIFERYAYLRSQFDFYEEARREEIINQQDFIPSTKTPLSKLASNKTPKTDFFKNVGRNDPCPCGSGRKFKKCCLN